MTIRSITDQTGKFVSENSPAILTALGVTGLITTAVLTGKASFKAYSVIDHAERIQGEFATDREKFEMTWKLYIPPFVAGSLSIAAIVGANRIGSRRAAAVTAAYALSERAYSEYKEKVVEQIGKNKEQKIRDEIAVERQRKNPLDQAQVIVTGRGKDLFMDADTNQYVESDMESVKKAINDTNYQIINQMYASVSDYYDAVGFKRTPTSDDMGWDTDNLINIHFTTSITDDQRPCFVMTHVNPPIPKYWRSHH
jgi:hypothetical protein